MKRPLAYRRLSARLLGTLTSLCGMFLSAIAFDDITSVFATTSSQTASCTVGKIQTLGGMILRPQMVYALTGSNQLISFDQRRPENITSRVSITGLVSDENLLDIDFRPATRQLYGVGSTSQIYMIDTATGTAKPVGSPFTPALEGTKVGMDFNPTVDRIRLITDTGQNLRLNPDTGAVAATDGRLAFAPGDRSGTQQPKAVSAAYTNSFNGATTTTLYNIDSALDVLVSQLPPNNGTLNTVGSLCLDTTEVVGFDIGSYDRDGLAALQTMGSSSSNLYVIEVPSGQARFIGKIGDAETVRGVAIPIASPGRLGTLVMI